MAIEHHFPNAHRKDLFQAETCGKQVRSVETGGWQRGLQLHLNYHFTVTLHSPSSRARIVIDHPNSN